jgi:CRP-like cAMP-binding protein
MDPSGPENTERPPQADAPETPQEPHPTADEPAATWRDDLVGALNTSDPPASTPSGGPLVGEAWAESALPRENRLLAALPRASYDRLRPKLVPVETRLKELVWEMNAPIRYVYFPLNGIFSLLSILADGSSVEVGTVGNEGVLGVPVVLGATQTPLRAVVQVPGMALRMTSEDLRQEVQANAALREGLQRYTQALLTMFAQAAACNRAHTAYQRLALWLLMCHDRVGTATFPVTHEFMAQMMGVRRATVTQQASRLQQQGAIAYHRGMVTISHRPALEAASCPCYRVIRGEYDRLLGPDTGRSLRGNEES